jgi:hypothetical protein
VRRASACTSSTSGLAVIDFALDAGAKLSCSASSTLHHPRQLAVEPGERRSCRRHLRLGNTPPGSLAFAVMVKVQRALGRSRGGLALRLCGTARHVLWYRLPTPPTAQHWARATIAWAIGLAVRDHRDVRCAVLT